MRKLRGKRDVRITAVVALALMLAAWLLLANFVFVVRRVEVRGNEKVSAEDVIRVSGLPLGKYLGQVREQDVAQRLLRDGRMQLVDLQMRLPDKIVLVVSERKSAAMAVYAGKIVILDEECVVMELSNSTPEQTVLYVSGLGVSAASVGSLVQAPEDQIAAVRAVLQALQTQNAMGYVSELNVENVDMLYLYSRTGIKIILGSEDQMERKIAWTTSALQDLENRGETKGTLDVSSGSMADFLPDR